MSDQQKRKRDDTAAEANKRTRSAEGGIVLRMEDMPANWLQVPSAKKTRDAIAAANNPPNEPASAAAEKKSAARKPSSERLYQHER